MDYNSKDFYKMPLEQLAILRWHLKRRPTQICPDPQPYIWFLLGGRGSGKTLTAASHIFETAVNLPDTPENRIVRVALVGQTYEDVKKTMIEGATGLRSVIPQELELKWNRTLGELTYVIREPFYREIYFTSYTAQVPAKLRGPNFQLAWVDEPAKFEDADVDPNLADTTWSNLLFGVRLGKPHIIVSGTPTPCKLVLYLLAHPGCKTSVMTMWENRANLPEEFLHQWEDLDPNSRAYRQEVLAEVLLDNPNAMFEKEIIDETRADPPEDEPNMFKVLGYDPATSTAEDGDEAGIILCGYVPEKRAKGALVGSDFPPPTINPYGKTHAYVLEDLSGHLSPHEQTELVIRTILEKRVSDLIFEQNQGVDFILTQLSQALKDQTEEYTIRKHKKPMRTDFGSIKRFTVTATLEDSSVHKFTISAIHASTNKRTRAETASIRYSTKRVHHPKKGVLPTCKNSACGVDLESQMVTWNPENTSNRAQSPDRMDALVYCLLHIFGPSSLTSRKNSKLESPAKKEMTEEQKNPGRNRKHSIVSIYSADILDSRAGITFDQQGRVEFYDHPQLGFQELDRYGV